VEVILQELREQNACHHFREPNCVCCWSFLLKKKKRFTTQPNGFASTTQQNSPFCSGPILSGTVAMLDSCIALSASESISFSCRTVNSTVQMSQLVGAVCFCFVVAVFKMFVAGQSYGTGNCQGRFVASKSAVSICQANNLTRAYCFGTFPSVSSVLYASMVLLAIACLL
jgi:hypothetical protein